MNTDNKPIIHQLIELITKGNAHATFEQAVQNVTFKNVGVKPANLPYNIWMLVEHLRIAQSDILDFSINESYKELKWPDEYWPKKEAPDDENMWQQSLKQIQQDRDKFVELLKQPNVDLFKPFPHGNGQNLSREALLIADHNSYHTGEIVLIRRLLNDWNH